ncbi:VanZ family protein [Haloimpatiens sp. FM7315]|uniref:VanZ family protein n=1 Tax=Haloimpatiens sp. FM7315 TaxID=3298609 RepID=UPI00370ABEBE
MKKTFYKKKFISYCAVLIWMIVIFKFSSEPANISDAKSRFAIDILNTLGLNLNTFIGKSTNYIIRKIGHITEYMILSILLFKALSFDFSKKKTLIYTFFLSVLYACSDEFHQTFILGRSGQFTDVLIDSLGILIGISAIYKLNKILLSKRQEY